jgi:integration host factor subunit beta
MSTTTKNAVIDRIADKLQIKRTLARDVLECFFDMVISDLSKGHRLEFRDFGVFEIRDRAARTAQNPKTLEPVPVPPKRSVKFKSGRLMRDRIENKPRPKRRQAMSISRD